jgi:hypothetical protein
VVLEEHEKIARRIVQRLARRRRPHRGDQRDQEVVGEVLGEGVTVQELADGRVVRVTLEQEQCRAVEAPDLGQHEQVARTGQRRQGREQPTEPASTRILQSAGVVAHGHRHVCLASGDSEFIEEPAQGRIGAVVVHEEGRVHANGVAVVQLDLVRVGVAAEPRIGLVEGHAVAERQNIGGDQA